MGMWDWFRHRLHSHRRADLSSQGQYPEGQGQYSRDESHWPFISCFSTGSHMFPMIRSCPPPKCLSRLPCSQILLGERLEDFSPDCWLENHLHRFGGQPENSHAIRDLELDISSLDFDLDIEDDSPTGSSENDETDITDDEHSAGTLSSCNLDSVLFRAHPRLQIEELFVPPDAMDTDMVIDSPAGYRQVIEPPPYFDFTNEAPPTYAEAVGHESDGNRTVSSERSSCDSTFLW